MAFDRVLTSPWCRCKETARLATGKKAEAFAPLSNLVGRGEHREVQVKALEAYLAGRDGNARVLFVTHGIVINALTGGPWWALGVLLGWGIGVLAHGVAVMGHRSKSLANWEERKLKQFMAEDR